MPYYMQLKILLIDIFLFKSNHILKLEDKILIESILFINNNLLPAIFKNLFTFCSDVQNYQTVSSTSDKIFKPSFRTDSFEKYSITIGAINSWNKIQYQFRNLSLKTYSPSKLKGYSLKNTFQTINEEVEKG